MQQSNVKRVQGYTWLDGEGDPLGIMQEIDQMNKWYMHNTESVLKNETPKFSGILRCKQINYFRPDD